MYNRVARTAVMKTDVTTTAFQNMFYAYIFQSLKISLTHPQRPFTLLVKNCIAKVTNGREHITIYRWQWTDLLVFSPCILGSSNHKIWSMPQSNLKQMMKHIMTCLVFSKKTLRKQDCIQRLHYLTGKKILILSRIITVLQPATRRMGRYSKTSQRLT